MANCKRCGHLKSDHKNQGTVKLGCMHKMTYPAFVPNQFQYCSCEEFV